MNALTAHPIFAQGIRSWSVGELAIAVIIIIALIAIVCLYLKHSGIAVPPWVWHLAWIVGGAILCIFAIRILFWA